MPTPKAASKKETSGITIPAMEIKNLTLTLIGDTPLIVHKWSEKAKKQMLDKMMKKARGPREAKDPQAEYESSLYRLPNGDFGFPSIGVKSAAVDAASFISDVTKVEIRGCFHIDSELVPIEGTPVMREDVCSVGMGGSDLRYRGEFKKWSSTFTIRYNASILSAEQIVNLFSQAGFSVGLGEWRPQRNGRNGLFHVATEQDLKQLEEETAAAAAA